MRALSRMVGEARGERRFTRSVCVALAGAARVSVPTSSGVLPPLQACVPVFGWPDSRTVLRRLSLSPDDLTLLWRQEVATGGARALLPEEVLHALFPPPTLEIAGRLVVAGPSVTVERLEAFCRTEAIRIAPVTRARPRPGRIAAGTIDATLAAGRRFCRAVSDVAARWPEAGLERWRWLPVPVRAADLGGAAGRHRPLRPTGRAGRGASRLVQRSDPPLAAGIARPAAADPKPSSAGAACHHRLADRRRLPTNRC